MSAFTRVVLAAAGNPLLERAVSTTGPGRAVSRRFVAGDALDDAIEVTCGLQSGGLSVSLDLLGEEVGDRATAHDAMEGYLACLDRIAGDGLDANISVKLTQLGLAIDQGMAVDHLVRLGRRAASLGTTVTVDMEDSRYTEATIEGYSHAQEETGALGIALQAYLHRTPEDLERVAPLRGHIRLCKGAYVESPSIAFTAAEEITAAYARLLERLMSFEETVPAIATHDDALIELARRHGRRRQSPWEYQMLFGVRPALQQSLVDEGMRMRVYLPFGSQWYPYLTRRMAERPANLAFFLRALTSRS